MAETQSKLRSAQKDRTGRSQGKVQGKPRFQARVHPGAQSSLPRPCLRLSTPEIPHPPGSQVGLSAHVGKGAPGAPALRSVQHTSQPPREEHTIHSRQKSSGGQGHQLLWSALGLVSISDRGPDSRA